VGGFYLGPIYYYFIAPFLLLSNFDPIGPVYFVVILGGLTIIALFLHLKNKISMKTALLAGFLYAVSSVLLKYNRFSWNPNVVPFFGFLFFIILEKLISSKKNIYAIFTGVLLGVLFQLHYLTFVFLPVCVILIILKQRHEKRRMFFSLLFVGLGIIIGWIPFIIYEIRHSLQNFSGLVEFITRGDGANVGFKLSEYLKAFAGDLIDVVKYLFNLPIYINITLAIVVAVYLFKNLFSKNAYKKLLAEFIVLNLVILSLYKGKMGEHYYNFLYVFFLIVIADILSFFFQKKYLIFGIVFVGLITYFSAMAYPFWHQPNKQLDQTIEISRYVFNKYVDKQPFNFALITSTNSDHAYRYFFDLWGNPPIEILNDVIDSSRKTVTKKLIVLCEPLSPCTDPRGHGLWEIAAFGKAEIEKKEKHGVYIIYQMKHFSQNNGK
jgi:hypothetical protein